MWIIRWIKWDVNLWYGGWNVEKTSHCVCGWCDGSNVEVWKSHIAMWCIKCGNVNGVVINVEMWMMSWIMCVDVDTPRFYNICGYSIISITKTRLYNIDPLKPHFYIVKLGFTGVYIIFLISAPNIDCGYSLEPPQWGGSNEYPQSMFWADIWKISEIFIWKFSVFGGEIFYIFK